MPRTEDIEGRVQAALSESQCTSLDRRPGRQHFGSAMESSAGLASLRARYVEDLEEAVNGVVGQLSSMPKVRKVVLFGSFAAGRRDLFTDVDLLVVMDTELDFVTRNAEMARCVQAGVALDLLVYTAAEMERLRERPFMRHVLATGEVLYESDPA